MLILTRRSGENIRIGDDITVSVIEIRGSQVRLGIEAPRNVEVHREEIFEVIQEQNRLAALQNQADLSAAKRIWQRRHKRAPRKGVEKR